MDGENPVQWLGFTASLSGRAQRTPSVRLRRALKELGDATLRDGLRKYAANDRTQLEAVSPVLNAPHRHITDAAA